MQSEEAQPRVTSWGPFVLRTRVHTLALDGVYTCAVGQGQPTRFLPLPPPEADEVARVLAGAARRIERLLETRAVAMTA